MHPSPTAETIGPLTPKRRISIGSLPMPCRPASRMATASVTDYKNCNFNPVGVKARKERCCRFGTGERPPRRDLGGDTLTEFRSRFREKKRTNREAGAVHRVCFGCEEAAIMPNGGYGTVARQVSRLFGRGT